MGGETFGIEHDAVETLARALTDIRDAGHELAVVIGGGNIFRGIHHEAMGLERVPADHMGMLATVMNGLALLGALKHIGSDAQVMSALECPKVAETYNWQRAHTHLEAGRILIFVGGTGNSYFSTDTCAALRANEIDADLFLKATKVDGIYDKDPVVYNDAKRYNTISYSEALAQRLQVMDATAFALCMSNNMPLFVFNMKRLGSQAVEEILANPSHGTLVKGD